MQVIEWNVPGTEIPYTPAERLVVESAQERARMFHEVPWNLFTTHTFTKPTGDLGYHSVWPEYLDTVRAAHRDTIGLLWCQEEVRAKDSLYRLAPHYHALWVTTRQLVRIYCATNGRHEPAHPASPLTSNPVMGPQYLSAICPSYPATLIAICSSPPIWSSFGAARSIYLLLGAAVGLGDSRIGNCTSRQG
jgi:hypothetical protein